VRIEACRAEDLERLEEAIPPGCRGFTSTALPGTSRGLAYLMYTRYMSENPVPLPYEVQEVTTTEARKNLPELVNLAAYGHVTTILVRDGKRLARIVPEEDAWIYSENWQDQIREAKADLAEGRVRDFDTDESFVAHLKALDAEAGRT
jgi:antitoxin (DNA-binding transcriptional repressor) of toxin-antitoxin stability system